MVSKGLFRWARNLAGAVRQEESGAFFATGFRLLTQSHTHPSMEIPWQPLLKAQVVSLSGKCGGSSHSVGDPKLVLRGQCEHYLASEFSQPSASCTQRVLHSKFKIRKQDTDLDVELLHMCRVHVGHRLRFFCTNSLAEDLDQELGEGLPDETNDAVPHKTVNSPANRLSPTRPRIGHRKERCFDDIIEKEKKLKIVLKIKGLLGAEPSRSMTLLDLGKSKDYIGFKGNGSLVVFLKRYPAVFRVHKTLEFGKLAWFQFTPEAEALYYEEMKVRKDMTDEVVIKLRKLLMMSNERRILLSKIAHLGRELGLPDDFRKSLVHEYPKYFRVVGSKNPITDEGPMLELVKWSDRLAITEADRKAQEQIQELGLDSPPRLDENIPNLYPLSKEGEHVVFKFHEVTCLSPYQPSNHLHPRSAEFEKRAVLLIQELLTLTLEKRVIVDHLTHFRKEFNFSKKVHGMISRHPEHFYISKKGSRDTVFMREAFEGVHIPGQRQEYRQINKHPLVLVKEKLANLMEVKPMIVSGEGNQIPVARISPVQDLTLPGPSDATTKIPW